MIWIKYLTAGGALHFVADIYTSGAVVSPSYPCFYSGIDMQLSVHVFAVYVCICICSCICICLFMYVYLFMYLHTHWLQTPDQPLPSCYLPWVMSQTKTMLCECRSCFVFSAKEFQKVVTGVGDWIFLKFLSKLSFSGNLKYLDPFWAPAGARKISLSVLRNSTSVRLNFTPLHEN